MLSLILGWILNLGSSSIVQKVIDVVQKHQDQVIESKKLETQIVLEELKTQVQVKQLQETLLAGDREKFLLWFPRALLYMSVCGYVSAIFFVSTFNIDTWVVLELPEHLKYITYAVVGMMTLNRAVDKFIK